MNRFFLSSMIAGILFPTMCAAQVKFNFNLGQRGPLIDDNFYGIFFEELSHAGDGGLYAEMIQNRSFEDDESTPVHWTAVGNAKRSLTSANMMNSVQKHALLVETSGNGDGIRNDGYWGISSDEGETCNLSFWIRSDNEWSGIITARLLDRQKKNIGETDIEVTATTEWKQYHAKVTSTATSSTGYFDMIFSGEAKVMLDMVSLFPPTFKNRENGMRRDLGQMLADIQPKFMRFPGGCYIEGTWDRNSDCRYLWKNSVGPQEERIPLWNSKWKYTVTNGQGIYEYLQYCEDIGAVPMYVVNIGVGHEWVHNYQDIGEYIQEALDVIEYCNGDVTTEWGAKRAENGHPEPFGLKYIEIGNENYTFDHYAERYIQFYNAIKEKYPDIVCIGNVAAWGVDYPTWGLNYPVDLVDEHYYRSPQWFMQSYNHYDNYARTEPKIYVGEWAASEGKGTLGNMNAALGEAIFMCGAEKNSDMVRMLSFSEPIAHQNDTRWPAMIYHNASMAVGTPSYYAQVLYGSNIGKQNVKWKEENNLSTMRSLGVATWSTSAEFRDIKVTDLKGNLLFDAETTTDDDWDNEAGKWNVDNGVVTNVTASGTRSTYTLRNALNTENIIYTLKAKKLSGAEGFLIPFDFKDVNNYTWWAIGGWGNAYHGIEQNINGTKTTLTRVAANVVAGREYDIRIIKEGLHVKCFLDNNLIHDFYMQDPMMRSIYLSATITDENGELFVKMVNPHAHMYNAKLTFTNGHVVEGTALVMNTDNGTLENSFDNPTLIVPHDETLVVNTDGTIDFQAKPFSINVLRLRTENVTMSGLVEEISLLLEEIQELKAETMTERLWENLQRAVNRAEDVDNNTPVDDQEQALDDLREALIQAKSIDVSILRKTVEMAEEEGADVCAAKDFLMNGTTSAEMANVLAITRDRRKLNAADKQEDVFEGSDPVDGGKYYIYNIGAQRYLAGGSEYGTHAAVCFAAQRATIESYGDGYRIRTNIRKGLEYLGDVGGTTTYSGGTRTYVDTNGTTWYFQKLDNGAYTISKNKTNEGATLLGFADKDWWTVEDNCTDANNPNNQWKFVTKEERDELLETATATKPMDATYYIHAPGFDRHLYNVPLDFPTQKWEVNYSGGTYGTTGYGTWYCDMNIETYNSTEFTLSQTLTGLKPGLYKLSAQGFYRHNPQTPNEIIEFINGSQKTDGAVIFATNEEGKTFQSFITTLVSEEAADKVPGIGIKTSMGRLPDNRGYPGRQNDLIDLSVTDNWGAAYYFETGLYRNEVNNIEVGHEGMLVIGFKKFNNQQENEWACMDNFRLTYLGQNNATGIEKCNDESIGNDDNTCIYDLSGRRISNTTATNLMRGVYIVNGTKVIVK